MGRGEVRRVWMANEDGEERVMEIVNITLDAEDYVHPSGEIIKSAEALARAMATALESSPEVTVSFRNMHFNSSYFNVLLFEFSKLRRFEDIEELVQFEFSVPAHREMFARSLYVVRKELGLKR